MLEGYDDVLTVEELMEILCIGKNTAYRLLNSGEIRAFTIGRKHKIPKTSIEEYIQRRICSCEGE